MGVDRVLTMRELRRGLADVVEQVAAGGQVYAGAYRKPEVVVMSVQQYEQLSVVQERAVRSMAASMQMEGMPLSAEDLDVARELAAGRIDFDEYVRRLGG